jgi:hypothetical protein
MDMVGHQAVCENVEIVVCGIAYKPVEITGAVVDCEEDILLPITTGCHVVGYVRDYYSCGSWH